MADDARDVHIKLIPAAEVDLEAIAALVNTAFARHEIRSGPRTSVRGLAREAGEDGEFLIASRNGKLVGSALIRSVATFGRADPRLANALYFGLAAVANGETNKGIGRGLLTEAERIALSRGHDRVFLGTVREFGLVDYYNRAGYSVARAEDYPAGHWGISVPFRYCEMEKLLKP
jgi:predicted N-acetyltransferase YhbS